MTVTRRVLSVFLGCTGLMFIFLVLANPLLAGTGRPVTVYEAKWSLPDIVKDKAEEMRILSPGDDAIVFSDLVQYKNAFAVGTGYLLYEGSQYDWYVILNHKPFSRNWVLDKNMDGIYIRLHGPDAGGTWTVSADIWFLFYREITVSLDTLEVRVETKADIERVALCLFTIIELCAAVGLFCYSAKRNGSGLFEVRCPSCGTKVGANMWHYRSRPKKHNNHKCPNCSTEVLRSPAFFVVRVIEFFIMNIPFFMTERYFAKAYNSDIMTVIIYIAYAAAVYKVIETPGYWIVSRLRSRKAVREIEAKGGM